MSKTHRGNGVTQCVTGTASETPAAPEQQAETSTQALEVFNGMYKVIQILIRLGPIMPPSLWELRELPVELNGLAREVYKAWGIDPPNV